MAPSEPTTSHDLVGEDEQITAAVEASIERDTAQIVRDYPLASLTPLLHGALLARPLDLRSPRAGLHHFPSPRAVPVRSWPLAGTPSPLPTFSSDNPAGFALVDRPLDQLTLQERGYVDQNLHAAGRIMQQVMSRQPVENLCVPRNAWEFRRRPGSQALP
jgi:hypothetical protein